MALIKVIKSINFQRDDGSYLFKVSGTPRKDLTAEGATESAADANLEAQIEAKRDSAQGDVDELNAALALAQQ